MALEVLRLLGLVLWLVLGLAGVWLLVTGRRTVFGLPKGIREGWPLRLYGLFNVLVAGFLIFRLMQASFTPDGVVVTLVLVGIAVLIQLDRWRKSQTREA
jgi:hypothetical protein